MVRSLLRDEAATYLAPFLHEDHSVGEAADLLKLPLARVHYWVRSLYDAGLLDVASATPRKGRSIKRYRAIASEFVVPAEHLPDGHFNRQMRRINEEMSQALEAAAPEWVISGDFRVTATSPQRGTQDRVLRGHEGRRTVTHQSTCRLRVTQQQARELMQELNDLRDRWIERSQDESDLQSFQLGLALAPVPD